MKAHQTIPTLSEEEKLVKEGYQFIAGVDEVGRGALAGPVVAASVILPVTTFPWSVLVRDSKQLSHSKRVFLCNQIKAAAIAIGVGIVSPQIIDARGILKATCLAMQLAVEDLSCSPQFLLIDGMYLPELSLPQKRIVKGDTSSMFIACASIVAKITRDQLMLELDSLYPGYGLARHKGYGTKAHLDALYHLGPSPSHRHSFLS